MQFGKDYFDYLKYSDKEQLISSHISESLRWASRFTGIDLLDGAGKSALDVGCALGFGVSFLRSLGYDVVGSDITSYGLLHGQANNRENGFVLCDAHDLPFRDFDLVICFEVLEHLERPLEALQSVCDSSSNVILCTTPNRTFERVVKRLLRDFDKTHINVKTPSEWQKLINENLSCKSVKIQSFVDLSLQFGHTSFYGSLKLPFGMETRILIQK